MPDYLLFLILPHREKVGRSLLAPTACVRHWTSLGNQSNSPVSRKSHELFSPKRTLSVRLDEHTRRRNWGSPAIEILLESSDFNTWTKIGKDILHVDSNQEDISLYGRINQTNSIPLVV